MAESRAVRQSQRRGHQSSKRTLASKVGVPAAKLSRKIATVKREDPSLSNRQAAGKAAGILRHRKKHT